ncbi:MAG TPA: DNA internalization-related competence protein ComEC/Rec2 [Bacillota bacterium]
MKGLWHVVALSVSIVILYIFIQQYWILLALIGWLAYLVLRKRLGKLSFFISLTLSLFFLTYIPVIDESSLKPVSTYEQITGQVIKPLNKTERKINFIIEHASTNENILVLYFLNSEPTPLEQRIFNDIKHGASCDLYGKLQPPPSSRNPGQFDYRMFLQKQGITDQLVIESIEHIQCDGSSFFMYRIYKMRLMIQQYIQQQYSDKTAAWIQALVFGSSTQLDDETVELFQRWSLSHLLAISGLHVGLMIGLLYFFLLKCGLVTKEKARWLLIIFLPLYAVIAGGKPSVWRASMMAFLILICSKMKIKLSITDLISIVFLLLLLVDPYIIYQVGFQFSFLVTFGLILSRRWIMETDSLFFQLLKISFISQMIIVPLQFAYFYSFQPLSIMLNTIVVPYFSLFVIPLMFVLTVISPIPVIPLVVDHLFVRIHHFFIGIIKQVDQLFYEPWVFGSFPFSLSLLYYGLFILLMIYIYKHRLITAFSYGCSLTLLIITIVIQPYFSEIGTVTMLDIGQGDAFVLELPQRQGVFFFDAGANFSFLHRQSSDRVYKQILKPYLYFKGIRKIDAIFISHEDVDHSGSVDDLVKEMNVKTIVISDFYEVPKESLQLWKEQKVTVLRVKQHDEIVINDQRFTVLSPLEDRDSPNENSLVIYTHVGGWSWLFTGDIGKETERQIIETYDNLSVDVLKVGHHGSDTSTDETFIATIQPVYALISVGENNMYGHPTPNVLQILEEANVHVLRTDRDGAVIFRYKNNKGTFYKYAP